MLDGMLKRRRGYLEFRLSKGWVTTYRTIELICKENLYFQLVVVANDTLTWPDEEAGRRSGLDLEHDRDVALVDYPDRRLRTFFTPWLEANVRNGVKRHKLAPVLGLRRWRAKRCLMLRHLYLKSLCLLKK